MELTEPIESINRQLAELFGIDTESSRPIWRVVWADDQYEKRWIDITPEGFQLVHPQIFEVKKYMKHLRPFHVLERLVLVPVVNQREIPEFAKSYEPIHFFFDKNHNALPPKVYICKFIIDTIYAAQGKHSLRKYVDPDSTPEAREKRIAEMMEYLFDDESFLLGRTITGEAVAYTGEPKITSQTIEGE